MAYLDQKVVRPCHDESNDDLSLTRNRIRHELIPHLEATYNPNLRETLHRTARILREEEAWIESHLDADWSGLLPASGGEGARIDRGGFLKAPAALQRRILRRGLARVAPGLKRIGFDHVEAIRRLADGPLKTPKWLDLPKGLGVAVDAAHITLLAASAAEGGGRRRVKERCSLSTADRYQHEIASPPETSMTVELPEIDARLVLRTATCDRPPMPASPHQALFDLDRLAFPLTLRSARPGDRLRPLGMRGHKKVSDLFVDCKIPKSNRGRHPVMISGGGIVWVAGVRRDHDTRVRADTRRLLIGDFCLLK
jgi:tRNA(Ile)-lysidine synthase